MLSNLSSANNPVNESSVIQKAQNDYAEIDQRVDDLETEVAENTAALNQQGAQITSLANQVADVAAKTTFPTINTNRINSAGAGSVSVGSSLNVAGTVTAPNANISGSLTVGGTNFNTVRDNAATAAADASTAVTKANQAVTKANATETALNEYKDQIATSVSTGSANISGGLTVGETVNANDVVSNEGHFGSIETPSIDVKEIKSAGSLELPAQMSTPNDWFTVTVPNGITATFSGSYQDKKYKFTVDKGNIEYDQGVLELIKDVSFKRSDNNVRIRVKADEALTYSFTDTGAVEPISIQKSTEAYADYSYAPQKARGTIYKGFDDRTSEVQIPGVVCASILRADEQEYVISAVECQIISKKLYLPDDWDETGMISCTSGTDNQYVSNATKDGCVSPTWKTPVETAVDGKLSNTRCLITEKAVSEYNGTVDDGTDVTYPITNIGDDACVHGKLTAECLVAERTVCGCYGNFTCSVQAPTLDGYNLKIQDIDVQAPMASRGIDVKSKINFCGLSTFCDDACFKETVTVDCDANFGEDVHIAGDLYVNGVSHVVDEETIETPSNEIMLRQNATTGLANTEISGILINKYNGTDSLTIGTDNTGTLRVGTGTGTSTSYATICHNQSENKWYVDDAEVTPVGVLQSYATKTEEDPYTVYTDAVFLAIDKTSLEPVLARDEEADMTQCGITYWDATNTKAKTASKIKYNNNGLDFDGKTCIEATQTTITDGTDTTTIDATKIESKCGCFTDACVECKITSDIACACTCVEAPLIRASTCLEACDGKIECNFLICGSLTVCGPTAITGLMSDCVATSETNCNDTFYVPIVHCNNVTQGANTVCTDGAFKYNPNSNTLCVENVCFTDTSCITCACVENECVNNLCVGTVVTNADATKSAIYCVTNVTGNTDFAIPLYNKNITNVNSTKKAELSYVNLATAPRYNPSTNTFCVCCVRTGDLVADGGVFTCCIASTRQADLAAGASKNITIYSRCKNSSGTVCSYPTTFCGTDGKVYNNYGFVGPNNYHNCVGQAGGATKYFEVVPRDNTTSNRSVHLDFTIYNANYSINLFYSSSCGCWMVRSFDDNRSVYEQAACCRPYGHLGFSEGNDKKHLFFCYTGYSAMTIDGDQQFTVNMCSSNPTTCNYRNSYSRIACGAECLYDYADHGWVQRYNGLLQGAWCIEATGGQVTIAHDRCNEKYGCIGALTNGIISVQKEEYVNPFYPATAINWMYENWADISDIATVRGFQCLSYAYLPAYASKTCCSAYTRNRGFLISGGTTVCCNGCCLGGYVFGLVGQCDCCCNYYSLPRAVYGYRNTACKNCVVQSGVWRDNKLYELIDERGGQVICDKIHFYKKDVSYGLICIQGTSSSTPVTSGSIYVGIDFDSSGQKGCLAFTEYDTYLKGASLTFATDQGASWFCSQYVKSDMNVTCSLRLYHCATSTNWQSLACVSFGPDNIGGSTHCSFLSAACPDANGINIAFGQNAQTIIYAGESAQNNFANFITQNGAGEKVVLVSDSAATDIVLNANNGVTGSCKWCFQTKYLTNYCYQSDGYKAQYGLRFEPTVLDIWADEQNTCAYSNTGFIFGRKNTVKANCVYVFGCGNTNGAPSTVPSNVIMIGTGNDLSYNNVSKSNTVVIGACNFDCSTTPWNTTLGFCNINYGQANVSIGYGQKTYDYAIAIGDNNYSTKYNTTCCEGIHIGHSTVTSVTGISAVGIGTNAHACGSKSVAIGNLTCAATYSVAIGACSSALTGSSVAIGVCSCSQTYAVAIGCDAKATYYSVSIGCAAVSNNSSGIAIGHGAKNCVQSGIAIGDGSNTSAYSSACVLVDERAGSRIRRSIICWNTGTKQCDLFCAIYCRFNFNYYADCSTVYVSVNGVYDSYTLNEIKWDKNETPKNFDLGRQGFTNAITIYDGCNSTIPKAGYVQIVGYAR